MPCFSAKALRLSPLRWNCSTMSFRSALVVRFLAGYFFSWFMPPAYEIHSPIARCTSLTAYVEFAVSISETILERTPPVGENRADTIVWPTETVLNTEDVWYRRAVIAAIPDVRLISAFPDTVTGNSWKRNPAAWLPGRMFIGDVPTMDPSFFRRVSVPVAGILNGLAIAKPVLNPPSSSA